MQGTATGVTTVMIAVQFLHVGLNTLIKASISKGMSNFVFVAYSNLLAFCFLLPSTIIYHRSRALPTINTWIIFRIFVLSLLSCSIQTFMYTGIRYSSPTLASAMEDLTPAYTFIIAIIFRMEKLDLKLRSCQAKSIGTVVSIAGALTVTLYKGLPMTNGVLPNNVLGGTFLSSQQSEWLLGGFLLAAASFCISTLLVMQASESYSNISQECACTLSSHLVTKITVFLYIMQTWTIKDYPAELMLTTICCSFVVILSFMVAFIAEGNPKAWILKPDMELISIFYSAIFVISMRSVVHTWACRKKGPLYVAMFNPLGIVIALAMGVIFLGDALYLGSMIGAAIIAIGFYAVIWGQAQDEKMVNEEYGQCSIISSSSSAEPLLMNKKQGHD
ncbi:WAT1-related protein At5g40240-like isoform X1 [Gastrolobium bilobum]|uniref:WAT1-related protein At5g40240-like isoform X1 n=1 Tax=Gastrolobium bilobum TaxID=150636 RepID=UPI002AB16AA9|nr:WAT1-related protein At5g40240-like isoform X1 [Gastrolobium bilobum]